MPEVPEKFKGQAAMDVEQGKKLDTVEWEYEPVPWIEEAIDVKVSCCGVCGSCIHTINNGWTGTKYPCVVGHEIVGTVVRAGKNQPHKVGDRVGFGAQCGSCMECDYCKKGMVSLSLFDGLLSIFLTCAVQVNMCIGSKKTPGMIGTYQGGWPGGDGKDYTKGGYADYFRGFGALAVPIPEELSDEIAGVSVPSKSLAAN
jgi:alcohol dehydrogenase (NADP+)